MKGIAWFLQIITGALLFVFLGYHFVVTHITGTLEMKEALLRFSKLRGFYILLLLLASYHGFNGLAVIAEEYGKKGLKLIFYLLFLVVFAYGFYLLFTV